MMRERIETQGDAVALLAQGLPVDAPLRIPVGDTGKWVYLRMWSRAPHVWDRSHGCSVMCVVAMQDQRWAAHIPGIPAIHIRGLKTLQEHAAAMDRWLFSLGAEVVPQGEWPEFCVGHGAHPSRPPLQHEEVTRDMWAAAERAEVTDE